MENIRELIQMPPEITIGGAVYPVRQATDAEGDECARRLGAPRSMLLVALEKPRGVAEMLMVMYGVDRADALVYVEAELERIKELLLRDPELLHRVAGIGAPESDAPHVVEARP